MRIVLGTTRLASYQEGGGHWAWFLQYPLGLRALGHQVLWLDVLVSTGDATRDQSLIQAFFDRAARWGLAPAAAVMVVSNLDAQRLDTCQLFGTSAAALADELRSADLVLNFCCALRPVLLALSRRCALIDVDPGHLQVSAQSFEYAGLRDHDVHLTIGARIHAADCGIPTLGISWRTFEPFVYLPVWQVGPDPGPLAPFSSVTQWTWEELRWEGGLISVSKRTAYFEYLELPRLARRPFELAANIGATDPAGDRERLERNGWAVVDPHRVTASPEQYQEYIRRSRAELMCAKPLHLVMKTGWFSDRSIAYLATGRPVLAQDTGFSERLPTGVGLLVFGDMREAVEAVAEIDGNYAKHSRAARELAEAYFDSRKCLAGLVSACEG